MGHNAYAYCLGNPVRYKDSLGKEAEEGDQNKEDKEIEDVTEDLNALMAEHAKELFEYRSKLYNSASRLGGGIASAVALFGTIWFFISKVTDHGEWDIKNSTEKYSYKKKMIYNGVVYTGEQIGNIHFGYVGRAVFKSWFLHFGAGLNQLKKGFKEENIAYFFDEPDDYEMIEYGIRLYEESK